MINENRISSKKLDELTRNTMLMLQITLNYDDEWMNQLESRALKRTLSKL